MRLELDLVILLLRVFVCIFAVISRVDLLATLPKHCPSVRTSIGASDIVRHLITRPAPRKPAAQCFDAMMVVNVESQE